MGNACLADCSGRRNTKAAPIGAAFVEERAKVDAVRVLWLLRRRRGYLDNLVPGDEVGFFLLCGLCRGDRNRE